VRPEDLHDAELHFAEADGHGRPPDVTTTVDLPR
jgi:hypothetical protein